MIHDPAGEKNRLGFATLVVLVEGPGASSSSLPPS